MVLLEIFLAWFALHLHTFKLTFEVPEKLPFGQLPTRTTTIRLFGLDLRKTVTKFCFTLSSWFKPVLSFHCLAALDLRAGDEQPIDCLIIKDRQAVHSMGMQARRQI